MLVIYKKKMKKKIKRKYINYSESLQIVCVYQFKKTIGIQCIQTHCVYVLHHRIL